MLLRVVIDLLLELSVQLRLLHLVHDVLDHVDQLALVLLYQALVAADVRIVLELAAEFLRLAFELV